MSRDRVEIVMTLLRSRAGVRGVRALMLGTAPLFPFALAISWILRVVLFAAEQVERAAEWLSFWVLIWVDLAQLSWNPGLRAKLLKRFPSEEEIEAERARQLEELRGFPPPPRPPEPIVYDCVARQ